MQTQIDLVQIKQDQQINYSYQSKTKSFFIGFIIVFGNLFTGFTAAFIGVFPYQQIADLFGLQYQQQYKWNAIFNGTFFLFGGIGALSIKLIIKKFTRRQILFISDSLGIFATILVLIPNVYCFIIGHILQGLVAGFLTTIIPIYNKQMSPKQISGSLGTLSNLTIIFGMIVLDLLALNIDYSSLQISQYHYVIFAFPFVFIVSQLLLLIFYLKLDSPIYYLLNNMEYQAKKSIAFIFNQQKHEQIMNQKLKQIQEINMNKNNSQENKKSFKGTIMRIVIGMILASNQQMSGSNIINVYGTQIIRKFPDVNIGVQFLILIYQIIKLLGNISLLFILFKFGRRPMILIGTFLIVLIQITIIIGKYIIITSVMIFIYIYGLTIGPLTWMYIAQILEPKWVGLAIFTNWIFAGILNMVYPLVVNSQEQQKMSEQQRNVFILLVIYCGISFIIELLKLKETKGKTSDQIYIQYDQKRQQ